MPCPWTLSTRYQPVRSLVLLLATPYCPLTHGSRDSQDSRLSSVSIYFVLPHKDTPRPAHTVHVHTHGSRSRQPTVSSAGFLYRTSSRQHTHNTRTHTMRRPCSSVLSSVVPPLLPPVVLSSTCLPAPFPCRTRLVNTISGELAETLRIPPPTVCSEFAAPRLHSSTCRSPAHTNLFTFLQTRTHQVAGGQPSTAPANTNLFTFLPDAPTPGCR